MPTVNAEITFMVYGQNGSGKIQKRTLELESQDFIACTSSNRDKNEELKAWTKTLFPTAKEVKIQSAIQLKKEDTSSKKSKSKKSKKQKKSVFKGNILFLPFRIIYRILGWIFRNA